MQSNQPRSQIPALRETGDQAERATSNHLFQPLEEAKIFKATLWGFEYIQ